jgi:hypothetical protein
MPGGSRRNVCTNCRGGLRCIDCYGSGQNIHLNDPDPLCRTCRGSGVCPICNGTGKLDEVSIREAQKQFPIGLRLIISVFSLLVLSIVLTGANVRRGKGGPMVPKSFGILFAATVCVFCLRVWSGVTWRDLRQFYFDIRNPSHRQSLFDNDSPRLANLWRSL